MTEGQRLAKTQIEAICAKSGGLLRVLTESESDSLLELAISISCQHISHRAPEGLPLRSRERFKLSIPTDFPYHPPTIEVDHQRWKQFPHVQWGNRLCLFLSQEVEWSPSDGMFGFFERLELFLKAGALNELDPIGQPLHPPVAYTESNHAKVLIRTNTPTINSEPWLGYAGIHEVNVHRSDLTEWSPVIGDIDPRALSVAVLLPGQLSFEYPSFVDQLFAHLQDMGVSRDSVYTLLASAASHKPEDLPLFIVLGTQMRGISGGKLFQHLSVWRIPAILVTGFRLLLLEQHSVADFRVIGTKVRELIDDWALNAKIEWCRVYEERSDIVSRRDNLTSIRKLDSLSVEIWGCGAIGGNVAEQLVRAGVKNLTIIDNSVVTPGILVRQNYTDADLLVGKVYGLKRRLEEIAPDVRVNALAKNVIALLESGNCGNSDLIVDATASRSVALALDKRVFREGVLHATYASMCISHKADSAFVVFVPKNSTHGGFDIERKTKLELLRTKKADRFLNEYWPEQPRTDYFQPEPGCSSPTFQGSASDLDALTGAGINLIADWVQDADNGLSRSAFIPNQAAFAHEPLIQFSYLEDLVLTDPHNNWQIKLSQHAWSELVAWICHGRRSFGEKVETGGLIFGERNDLLRILWVDTVSGPPADSVQSESEFVCGTDGNEHLNNVISSSTRRTSKYVGLWHTHPKSIPKPSQKDIQGMNSIGEATVPSPLHSLMLIVGIQDDEYILGGYVLPKGLLLPQNRFHHNWLKLKMAEAQQYEASKIALTLSGGGSRAIAFHLGCMRALHDKGLLAKVDVISSVSGGAVIAAMYAYSEEAFAEFEEHVKCFLRKGLVGKSLWQLLCSSLGWRVMIGTILSAILGFTDALTRFLLVSILRRRRLPGILQSFRNINLPNLTDILESVLGRNCFAGKYLADPTRNNLSLLINACEVGTGTAFRFGNRRSYSWRFGKVEGDVPVSLAVAASAAYPVILPPLGRTFTLVDSNKSSGRFLKLVDGGVYDNLGTSALMPDRLSEHDLGFHAPSNIICCDAGYGQVSEQTISPFVIARILAVSGHIFRKLQDTTRARIFDLAKNRYLDSLVISQLGQQDSKLDRAYHKLPSRKEVISYPTNFSKMKDIDIDLLVARGEYLTRAHLESYLR